MYHASSPVRHVARRVVPHVHTPAVTMARRVADLKATAKHNLVESENRHAIFFATYARIPSGDAARIMKPVLRVPVRSLRPGCSTPPTGSRGSSHGKRARPRHDTNRALLCGSEGLAPFKERGVMFNYKHGAMGCCTPVPFGGQSVVPWELALFLIEEMKFEGITPAAVVYTAALAECRWAGQAKHVEYVKKEMEDGGMTIVSGITGVVGNELPPSQAPPLFGKQPEPPPKTLGNPTEQTFRGKGNTFHGSSLGRPSASPPSAIESAIKAARVADKARATIETMWATGKHEPTPETCLAALNACAAGGQWEAALAFVRDAAASVYEDKDEGNEDVESGKETPTEGQGTSARVQELAGADRWEEALTLVQDLAGREAGQNAG